MGYCVLIKTCLGLRPQPRSSRPCAPCPASREVVMKILRTLDERFAGLADYSFEPRYVEVGDGLRVHYLDEGPAGAAPVLLLHGEPSWCSLYRTIIPVLAAAGHGVSPPTSSGSAGPTNPPSPATSATSGTW